MSFKKLLGILALLGLTGCGFQPMMCGEKSQTQCFELHVKGDGFPTYKFRRELEKHLAYVPKFSDEVYIINLVVGENQVAASFAQDATVTLSQSSAFANYTIRVGNTVIKHGHNDITTSFPVIPSDEFITKNASISASTRLAIALAEEVSRDVVRLIKTQD